MNSTREAKEKSAAHVADAEKELGLIPARRECREAGPAEARRGNFAEGSEALAPEAKSEASTMAADAAETLVSAAATEWEALDGATWKSAATGAASAGAGAGCLAQAA